MADARNSDPAAQAGRPAKLSAGQATAVGFAILPLAAFLSPTLCLVGLGMMPTVAAYIADRTRFQGLAITVGFLNLAGCLPLVVELWSRGQTFDAIGPMMHFSLGWLLAFGAAAIGWIVHFVTPALISTYMAVLSRSRIAMLRNGQKHLIEVWGEEVVGTSEEDKPATD